MPTLGNKVGCEASAKLMSIRLTNQSITSETLIAPKDMAFLGRRLTKQNGGTDIDEPRKQLNHRRKINPNMTFDSKVAWRHTARYNRCPKAACGLAASDAGCDGEFAHTAMTFGVERLERHTGETGRDEPQKQ